jgi:hypothetical protein
MTLGERVWLAMPRTLVPDCTSAAECRGNNEINRAAIVSESSRADATAGKAAISEASLRVAESPGNRANPAASSHGSMSSRASADRTLNNIPFLSSPIGANRKGSNSEPPNKDLDEAPGMLITRSLPFVVHQRRHERCWAQPGSEFRDQPKQDCVTLNSHQKICLCHRRAESLAAVRILLRAQPTIMARIASSKVFAKPFASFNVGHGEVTVFLRVQSIEIRMRHPRLLLVGLRWAHHVISRCLIFSGGSRVQPGIRWNCL